jgi:hypothetical protein
MTPMRKRIAERLVEAQTTAAILTTFNEVDMGAVMELRKQHQERFVEKHGVKLGFMSFFVKSSVEALKEIPQVNAEVRGDSIVYRNYCDVGIAVGGGKGLSCRSCATPNGSRSRRSSGRSRLRRAREGQQARPRGAHRRHVHDLQRRDLRLAAQHADPQSRRSRASSACTRSRTAPSCATARS